MKMRKWTALALAAACAVTVCAGCGQAERAENELILMMDSAAFLYGFENIDEAIAEKEEHLRTGQERDNEQNRMLIANTQLLKAWGEEKGVNITSKNWGWGTSLTNKLLSAFLYGDTPDLILAESQMPGFARQGYLEPFPDDLASFVRENLSPIAYRDMEFDGKIYGISMTTGISLLVWNKAILREAEVSEEIVENGPATWTEWENTMQKIREKGKNAGGVYVGNGGVNYGALLRTGTLLEAGGGGYAAADGSPAFDSEQNVAALEFLRRQADYNTRGYLTSADEDTYFSYFNTGKMAYKVDGLWALPEAEEYGLDVGYCLMPSPEAREEKDRSTLLIGAGYYGVPVYAQKKDLAWEALRFMLGEDVQKNIARGGERPPALLSVLQTAYDDTSAEWYHGYMKSYKELMLFASENDSARGLPAFYMKNGSNSKLWEAVGNCISRTVTQKTAVNVLAKEAQDAMQKEWTRG